MNTLQAQYKDWLLQERQQLLQRIAAQRGGQVSRVDMAAEHDVRASDARAQATTEINEEFAMNEHETAELAAIEQQRGRSVRLPVAGRRHIGAQAVLVEVPAEDRHDLAQAHRKCPRVRRLAVPSLPTTR